MAPYSSLLLHVNDPQPVSTLLVSSGGRKKHLMMIDCCMVPHDVGDHFWAKFSILPQCDAEEKSLLTDCLENC